MYIAGILSRAFIAGSPSSLSRQLECVNMVDYPPISSARLREIQHATASGETLQTLKTVIINDWPATRQEVHTNILPYFHIRDEQAAQNGSIFRGDHCIIPKALRPQIVLRLHSAHLGIEGCLRRARECLHWPGMNPEIRDYVEKCDTCRKYQTSNTRETMMSHAIPARPRQKVGTDLFSLKDKNYLVTVDYFSNY